MGWLLRKCGQCGAYTLNPEECPYCRSKRLLNPNPAKFSLDDRYGRYRRELKRQAQSATRT